MSRNSSIPTSAGNSLLSPDNTPAIHPEREAILLHSAQETPSGSEDLTYIVNYLQEKDG